MAACDVTLIDVAPPLAAALATNVSELVPLETTMLSPTEMFPSSGAIASVVTVALLASPVVRVELL